MYTTCRSSNLRTVRMNKSLNFIFFCTKSSLNKKWIPAQCKLTMLRFPLHPPPTFSVPKVLEGDKFYPQFSFSLCKGHDIPFFVSCHMQGKDVILYRHVEFQAPHGVCHIIQ